MHLLTFLADASGPVCDGVQELEEDCVEIEYRLECGGELYSRRVGLSSWRELEMARLLLRRPFEMFVVSWPSSAPPQELCLRFKLRYVYESQNLLEIIPRRLQDVPDTIGAGTAVRGPGRVPPSELPGKGYVPPVTWFERLFSSAARRLIADQVRNVTPAFVDIEDGRDS